MATRVNISVEGLEPLIAKMARMPARAQQTAFRKAIDSGSKPLLKDARRRARSVRGSGTTPSGRSRKHLDQTIKKKRKTYRKAATVMAVVGPDAREAPHAHLVHEGTRPHFIPRSPVLIGGEVIWGGVHHPGAKAFPFMEEAGDAQKSAMVNAMRTTLQTALPSVAKGV